MMEIWEKPQMNEVAFAANEYVTACYLFTGYYNGPLEGGIPELRSVLTYSSMEGYTDHAYIDENGDTQYIHKNSLATKDETEALWEDTNYNSGTLYEDIGNSYDDVNKFYIFKFQLNGVDKFIVGTNWKEKGNKDSADPNYIPFVHTTGVWS